MDTMTFHQIVISEVAGLAYALDTPLAFRVESPDENGVVNVALWPFEMPGADCGV